MLYVNQKRYCKFIENSGFNKLVHQLVQVWNSFPTFFWYQYYHHKNWYFSIKVVVLPELEKILKILRKLRLTSQKCFTFQSGQNFRLLHSYQYYHHKIWYASIKEDAIRESKAILKIHRKLLPEYQKFERKIRIQHIFTFLQQNS